MVRIGRLIEGREDGLRISMMISYILLVWLADYVGAPFRTAS